jgi:transposase InsO family protein
MSVPEDFAQLALRVTDPVQYRYEVIRDIMLADATIAERSQVTGVDRGTVAKHAHRFVEDGMLGLVDRRTLSTDGHQPYPAVVAGYVLYLKQLFPPIHDREIVRIIDRKYGYHTNHHTVKRFLARHPLPVQLPLPVTGFHQFEDAYRARWTVVRLFYEGWHQQSIAGLLKLSRKHVWHIVQAFQRDGFAGLEDQRTRPPTHPANQLSLPFLKQVLDVQQEYPRAGRFRVHGLLGRWTGRKPPSAATVGRAMALNRDLHGAPLPWVTDRPDPAAPDGIVKAMPFPPSHRHRYWFIDLRYLVRLGEDQHWVYSLLIIEGYTRKILAGMATESQDVVTVLQVLAAALREYGRPEAIVSDNGSVFTAGVYDGLLEELEITSDHIERGKPWQNLIEAQFKVELRLADAHFEQATTLEEIQERHAAFIETFNETPHWAHQARSDGLHTPAAVLSWVRGRELDPDHLARAVRHLQLERVVNIRGYVSVRRFYLYAERGLARRRVSVWLYDGRVHLAYQETILAEYTYHAERRARRLQAVEAPRHYQTPYASPQLELWELDDDQWRKILPRPYDRHPLRIVTGAWQLPLLMKPRSRRGPRSAG